MNPQELQDNSIAKTLVSSIESNMHSIHRLITYHTKIIKIQSLKKNRTTNDINEDKNGYIFIARDNNNKVIHIGSTLNTIYQYFFVCGNRIALKTKKIDYIEYYGSELLHDKHTLSVIVNILKKYLY